MPLNRDNTSQRPPPSLFKYMTPQRVDYLETQKIAFTPPERFNDILDVRPRVMPLTDRNYLGVIEQEVRRAFIKALPPWRRPRTREERETLLGGAVDHLIEEAPRLAKKWEDELPEVISQNFGVLCLSEKNDQHLMWAHYADDHRGLVVEFDTGHPAFQELGDPRKVDYLTQRPVYDPAEGAKGFWRQKILEWEYEREWRIVRELEQCEKRVINKMNVYICSLPLTAVKAVYIGKRGCPEIEGRIRAALKGTPIILHRTGVDDAGKLNFVRI